jgi:hypothetical protein
MTTLREAAQLALDAIIELEYSSSTAVGDRMAREAKQALRKALTEPQAEPVAWVNPDGLKSMQENKYTHISATKQNWATKPLYTHPQPAQQPLTDYQINDMASEYGDEHDQAFIFNRKGQFSAVAFARAIEAAHGIGGKQ